MLLTGRLIPLGAAYLAAALLVGCGSSGPSSSGSGAATSSMTTSPSATATASTAPASDILTIPQLNVAMRVPPGLTGLTYTVATPAEISHGAGGVNPSLLNFPQPAFNGVKPSTVLLLSSSAWRAALPGRFGCTGGSSGTGHTTLVPQGAPEAYISVWSVNPATLNFGQESIYGATIPHVGSTYFLLQYAGPFGGPGCAGSQHPTSLDVLQSRQANLLNQLVNSVAPA